MNQDTDGVLRHWGTAQDTPRLRTRICRVETRLSWDARFCTEARLLHPSAFSNTYIPTGNGPLDRDSYYTRVHACTDRSGGAQRRSSSVKTAPLSHVARVVCGPAARHAPGAPASKCRLRATRTRACSPARTRWQHVGAPRAWPHTDRSMRLNPGGGWSLEPKKEARRRPRLECSPRQRRHVVRSCTRGTTRWVVSEQASWTSGTQTSCIGSMRARLAER